MLCRLVLCQAAALAAAAQQPFVVRVVDSGTGRGVPLVELKTANQRCWYTDSNGIASISDPWLLGQDVFFEIRSHGYTFVEKFFDTPGKKLRVIPGARAELRIRRDNIAERLYRITGAGIYADSVAAGAPVPIGQPLLSGKVTGQDTAIAIPYASRLFWFWGDTFGPANANFKVSGATAGLPGSGGLDPETGIDLTYFTDESGFSKQMIPIGRPGLVWLEGLMTVLDPSAHERLVATYTRYEQKKPASERGIAVFDDGAKRFRVLAQFPSRREHRSSHPFRVKDAGQSFWYLYPNQRVPDAWRAIQDPHAYQTYTCEKAGASVRCTWKAGVEVVDGVDEPKLIEKGLLAPEAAVFPFIDVDTGRRGDYGAGSVAWNDYRKKWIMIAGAWGNVYYSEASAPHGPWRCAKRIVAHDNYNFYNVVHHPFFDKDRGRVIYFEGTYTTFGKQTARPTPLYDYNQILYKLSLDDARLRLPASCTE